MMCLPKSSNQIIFSSYICILCFFFSLNFISLQSIDYGWLCTSPPSWDIIKYPKFGQSYWLVSALTLPQSLNSSSFLSNLSSFIFCHLSWKPHWNTRATLFCCKTMFPSKPQTWTGSGRESCVLLACQGAVWIIVWTGHYVTMPGP